MIVSMREFVWMSQECILPGSIKFGTVQEVLVKNALTIQIKSEYNNDPTQGRLVIEQRSIHRGLSSTGYRLSSVPPASCLDTHNRIVNGQRNAHNAPESRLNSRYVLAQGGWTVLSVCFWSDKKRTGWPLNPRPSLRQTAARPLQPPVEPFNLPEKPLFRSSTDEGGRTGDRFYRIHTCCRSHVCFGNFSPSTKPYNFWQFDVCCCVTPDGCFLTTRLSACRAWWVSACRGCWSMMNGFDFVSSWNLFAAVDTLLNCVPVYVLYTCV